MMNLYLPNQRAGFTLIELLVVIFVLAFLLVLIEPAVGRAYQRGQDAQCRSNLRQIGIATLLYTAEHKEYPRAYVDSTCRWMDQLKPYLSKKSTVYCCPSDPQKIPVTWDASITMSYGINTFRFSDESRCFWYPVKVDAVARPSGTILLADCTPGFYYVGGGAVFGDPVPRVDYRHPGGSFNALFCDGHIESLQATTKEQWNASE